MGHLEFVSAGGSEQTGPSGKETWQGHGGENASFHASGVICVSKAGREEPNKLKLKETQEGRNMEKWMKYEGIWCFSACANTANVDGRNDQRPRHAESMESSP